MQISKRFFYDLNICLNHGFPKNVKLDPSPSATLLLWRLGGTTSTARCAEESQQNVGSSPSPRQFQQRTFTDDGFQPRCCSYRRFVFFAPLLWQRYVFRPRAFSLSVKQRFPFPVFVGCRHSKGLLMKGCRCVDFSKNTCYLDLFGLEVNLYCAVYSGWWLSLLTTSSMFGKKSKQTCRVHLVVMSLNRPCLFFFGSSCNLQEEAQLIDRLTMGALSLRDKDKILAGLLGIFFVFHHCQNHAKTRRYWKSFWSSNQSF